MIEFPTVFILGAGAGVPFGFPSGRELLTKICKNIDHKDSKLKILLQECGFKEDLIVRFGREMYLSKQPSVDLFLEKQPEYLNVGKAAIACALIPCEKPDVLHQRGDRQSWYDYLFSKLETDPNKFHQNKLYLITFNYDRSLEYFLFLALKNSYRLEDNKAAQLVNSINIIHVYGQLGAFPFLGFENERHYLPEINSELVNLCASCIKIIGEDQGESPEFSKAHELIISARRICFLGFGFHEVNVARLMINKVKQAFSSKWGIFCGSAFDIREGERLLIKKLFDGKIELGKENEDVLAYLRNNEIFLPQYSEFH